MWLLWNQRLASYHIFLDIRTLLDIVYCWVPCSLMDRYSHL